MLSRFLCQHHINISVSRFPWQRDAVELAVMSGADGAKRYIRELDQPVTAIPVPSHPDQRKIRDPI